MAISENPGPRDDGPYRIADPRQRQIHERLERLLGPGPAAHYRDACRLMDVQEMFASTTALVAHLLREIESAIRSAVTSLPADGLPAAEEGGAPSSEDAPTSFVAGDRRAEAEWREADADDERADTGSSQREEILAVLVALGIPPADDITTTWLAFARGDFRLIRYVHRNNFEAPRPVDARFRALWDGMTRILDVVLARFEARYDRIFAVLATLRELPAPTKADAARLVAVMPRNEVAHRFFFEALTNPAWVPMLRRKGMFQTPPAPIVDVERRTTTYFAWPESRFLARMARESGAQQAVASALDAMDDTENVRVIGDVLEALTAMPIGLAQKARSRILVWVERQDRLFTLHPSELQTLAAHLHEGGDDATARRILRLLLELRRRPRGHGREVTARLEPWDYRRLVGEVLPKAEFIPDPYERFLFLLELLEAADDAAGEGGVSNHAMRPAIEESDQNESESAFDALLSGIRDAAAAALAAPDRLATVVARLRQGEAAQPLKRRLELNLLRTTEPPDRERIRKALLDRELLTRNAYYHEYHTLLRDRFGVLAIHEQEEVLALLEHAPAVDRMRDERASNGETPLSPEEERELRERIARRALSLIAPLLPLEHAERYRRLVAQHGEARHPEFLMYTKASFGTWGSRTPVQADALAALSIADLRTFLDTWVPSANPFEDPTREGLSAVLTQIVAARPAVYAASVEALQVIEPTYVRGILAGFLTAQKEGRAIPWAEVLSYCEWAIRQELVESATAEAALGRDPGWRWVRDVVLDALRDGLAPGERRIPLASRSSVWGILETLARDPTSPTPEMDGKATDFVESAINSLRGRALELAMEYALWVREEEGPNAEVGFASMPEVQALLEERLDSTLEPSPSVRAVFGLQIGRLAYLDLPWLAAWKERIFPAAPHEETLRRAAWDAYLRYSPADARVYAALADIYEGEVARFLEHPGVRAEEERRLCERLTWLFVHGALTLAPTSPLLKILAVAPDALTSHAIESVGRALHREKGTVPPDALARLRDLWDARLDTIAARPEAYPEELEAYSWWFASKQFDAAWAADRLLRAAKLRGGIPANHWLLEALMALAPVISVAAVLILTWVVRGESEPMTLSYEAPAIRGVISGARSQPSADLEEAIQELLGLLPAKGCTDLLDLGVKAAPRLADEPPGSHPAGE